MPRWVKVKVTLSQAHGNTLVGQDEALRGQGLFKLSDRHPLVWQCRIMKRGQCHIQVGQGQVGQGHTV